MADYDLKLGRSHNFHIMAGTEWENYHRFDRVYATKDYIARRILFAQFRQFPGRLSTRPDQYFGGDVLFGRFNYNFRENISSRSICAMTAVRV